MDRERAVSGRDDVSLAQQHPPDAQAVDLGAVGASQIDQMTERGLAVDLEMFAREHEVLRSSKTCTRDERPTVNVSGRSIRYSWPE